MIELFLILLVSFLLTGMVLGHWMVFGGPSLNIFPIRRNSVGLRKPRRKAERQIKAQSVQPQSLPAKGVAVKHLVK